MKLFPFLIAAALAWQIAAAPRCLRALCAPASVPSVLNLSFPVPPQNEKHEWCKNLPRPEYKTLQRVLPDETWFEIYKVAPGVFAIYEPHQAEETISYLITGTKQALLFDTGMGIGNIKAVVARLTSRRSEERRVGKECRSRWSPY